MKISVPSVFVVLAAPVACLLATSVSTLAAPPQVIEITGDDTMKFNVPHLEAAEGEDLKISLVNIGKTPRPSMAHNWVLLKKDVDAAAFANAAATARGTEYLPVALSDEVIASTKLLGPGESDTVAFTVPDGVGEYTFLCTFPAHYLIGMKGVLVVK